MNNQKIFKGVGGIYRYHKLNHSTSMPWVLKFLPICSSTETELSNWIAGKKVLNNKPRAIFSSKQKFGQGQHGRIWNSPRGGVWVSAAICREGCYEKTAELYGLAVALALVERFELKGVDVKIKWPNDILLNGRKLAGILPKLFFRGREIRLIRVGVGLNVFNNVPQEGISLKEIRAVKKIDVNFWSSEVLFAIERSLDLLERKEFLCKELGKRLWNKSFFEKKTGNKWNIKGIHSNGGLMLSNGQKEIVWTGEI